MGYIKQKFVIDCNGEMHIGRREFHRDFKAEKPFGGGWWYWHQETDTLYLYSQSFDFGRVTQEQVDNAKPFLRNHFKNSKVVFEPNPDIQLVHILARDFGEEEAIRLVLENDYV